MKWLHDDNEPASLLLQTCKQKKPTFFPVFEHLHAHAYVDTCKLVLPLKCFKSSTNLMDRCISKFLEVQFYIFSDRKISFLAFTHNPLLSALLQFFFFFFFGGGGLEEGSVLKSFITFQLHVNSIVLETSICCSYQLYQNFTLMWTFFLTTCSGSKCFTFSLFFCIRLYTFPAFSILPQPVAYIFDDIKLLSPSKTKVVFKTKRMRQEYQKNT